MTLKWPEGLPTHGRIQTACRDKRYQSLLDVCTERNLKVLLVGHHQNDQLGKDRLMDRLMDRWMNRHTNEWMDEWIYRYTDGSMDQ